MLEGTDATLSAVEATARWRPEESPRLDHAVLGIDQRGELRTLPSDHLTHHLAPEGVGGAVGSAPVARPAVASTTNPPSQIDRQRSQA